MWSHRRYRKIFDVVAVKKSIDATGRHGNRRVHHLSNPLVLKPVGEKDDDQDSDSDDLYSHINSPTRRRDSVGSRTGSERFVLPRSNRTEEKRSPIPYSVRGELLKFRVRTMACAEVWITLVRELARSKAHDPEVYRYLL